MRGILQENGSQRADPVLRMIFLALVLVIPTFFYGYNLSYTATAMPQMDLSISEASWFASVSIYASPLSSIIAGLLIDAFGRKTVLLWALVPNVIGFSLMYSNINVFLILLGQIFNGLSMGACTYPVQVYAGECIMANNVRWRNIYMTWIGVSYSLGFTAMLLISNFYDYLTISAYSAIVCFCGLVIFYIVIPESPVWLYSKGRIGDAEWSQKKLGISLPIQAQCTSTHSGSGTVGGDSILARQLKILSRPDVYKPILILSVSSTVLSFCGTTTVTTYMIEIIDNTIPGMTYSSTTLESAISDSYRYSLISGVSMFLGSILSIAVLPRLGLKKMLIASKVFIILGLATLTYATFANNEFNVFLRTAAVALLSFFMGLELGPRTSFSGDVFPTDAKGFGCIPMITGSMASATANKIFPYLRVAFGGYAFLFYAGASFLAILIVHFFLPEVVGRTLDEINRSFKKEEN